MSNTYGSCGYVWKEQIVLNILSVMRFWCINPLPTTHRMHLNVVYLPRGARFDPWTVSTKRHEPFYVGVSLNGGTPNLHPKMIIFSRKTHGFVGFQPTILGFTPMWMPIRWVVHHGPSIGCCSSTALSDAVGMPDAWCQNGRFFAYHGSSLGAHQPPKSGENFWPSSGMTFFTMITDFLGFSSGFLSWGGWHWGYPSIPLSIVSVENTRHICLKQRNALHYCQLHEIHHPENIEKKSLTVFDYILCGILKFAIDAMAVISKLNLHPTKKDTKQDFFWVTCVNPPLQKQNSECFSFVAISTHCYFHIFPPLRNTGWLSRSTKHFFTLQGVGKQTST